MAEDTLDGPRIDGFPVTCQSLSIAFERDDELKYGGEFTLWMDGVDPANLLSILHAREPEEFWRVVNMLREIEQEDSP